ncbi:hypothetical protein SAMN02745164_00878 [Marinitoga hydrogenitolerans DSM 16785]|uniref:Uncharacterized protein n=1 Tax=Marinitoga hydrogenitolerans (strain DSM 16785 / JCM 12826 / AT1271) TaxID=1122195 RepID=A0A1M4V9R6_MARH1|nr:hypothetical protein [Marinitoga hydrogenitolerans]SHE65694.1 hypothetical protein SAMN02745164_00878 [Marinitoga hydrogenitolerans DSM 16785]
MLKIKFMSNLRSIVDKKTIELKLEEEKNIEDILTEIGNAIKSRFEVIKKEQDHMVVKLFINIMGQPSYITMRIKFIYNNEFISIDKKIQDGELQILPLLGGG